MSFLRQRFLQPHANHFYATPSGGLCPTDPEPFPTLIVEPRNPPRYQLELSEEPFTSPTQACLVPGAYFSLPQADAFKRGKFLINVTYAVTLLPEETKIESEAHLTLRLRDRLVVPAVNAPERLRIFRKNPDTGEAEPLPLSREPLVDFARGKGVRFPITQFGTYVVALELDRQKKVTEGE